MSDKKQRNNSKSGSKKNKQKKRQASSPLDDNGDHSDYSLTGLTVTTEKGEQKREQRKVKPKKKCKQNCPDTESSKNSGYNFAAVFTNPYQTMSFTPQSTPYNMSQPSYVSSPPGPFGATAFGYQATPPPPPPPWASKLLEDMEHVKQKLQCVEKIEKTVNMINVKVTDLETQMKSLDVRVNETEKSCKFISETNESNKKELKNAKDSLSTLQKSCQNLEKDAQSLKKENEKFDAKLIDLEARSMRENLMFYGIPEGDEHENCGQLVKEMCSNHLQMEGEFVRHMTFDRAHRVGQKSGSRTRPIVVKFHYFSEREAVRQSSFNFSAHLKSVNMGVGVQLPKDIRDARKPLYAKMKEAKDGGSNVRFVGKKLFIDGNEFVPAQRSTSGATGTSNMEH